MISKNMISKVALRLCIFLAFLAIPAFGMHNQGLNDDDLAALLNQLDGDDFDDVFERFAQNPEIQNAQRAQGIDPRNFDPRNFAGQPNQANPNIQNPNVQNPNVQNIPVPQGNQPVDVAPVEPNQEPAQNKPNAPQLSPEEAAEARRLAGELANDLAALEGEMAAVQAEVAPLRVEVDAMLERLDASDMGWFEDFRKEVFFPLPIGEDVDLTLSGADLFKTLFLFANGGCDYLLYENLSGYYVKNALYNFQTKKEMISSLLVQGQENHIDSEILEGLISEEFSTIFTFEKVLSSKMLIQLIKYLLSSESVKYLEHCVFPPFEGGWIAWFKKKGKEEDERIERQRKDGREGKLEIHSYRIIELLSMYCYGVFPGLENNLPSLRRTLLRYTGWHHDFMDTYLFFLAKRFLVLMRFLKQSNELYTKACLNFYKQNAEQFSLLIAEMAHTQGDANAPKNRAEEKLKALIEEAHSVAFLDWVKFKHSCCAWTDMWVESVLLLPIWYEAGKLVYRQIQKA